MRRYFFVLLCLTAVFSSGLFATVSKDLRSYGVTLDGEEWWDVGSKDFTSDGVIGEGEEYWDVGISNGATVDMTGGSVLNDLALAQQSTFNFYDGEIGGIYAHYGDVNMHGGTAYVLRIVDSVTNIHGGNIVGYIDIWPEGDLNIYGGNIDCDLYLSASALVHVHGYGFDYDSGLQTFTGFLADDSAFTFTDVDAGEYALLDLIIVPEPGTMVLFGMGVVAVWRRRAD